MSVSEYPQQKSVNSQPFHNFVDLHPQPYPNQNYMVPTAFQKQNSHLSYLIKCLDYFVGHFPNQDIFLWILNHFAQILQIPILFQVGNGVNKITNYFQIANWHGNTDHCSDIIGGGGSFGQGISITVEKLDPMS